MSVKVENSNILIDTSTPSKMSFKIESVYTKPECNDMLLQKSIQAKYVVCGAESVIANQQNVALKIDKVINVDPNFQVDLRALASDLTSNDSECGIVRYALSSSKTHPSDSKTVPIWKNFIDLNLETMEMNVKLSKASELANNTQFSIYLVAISKGEKQNWKQIDFSFTQPLLKTPPALPKFS